MVVQLSHTVDPGGGTIYSNGRFGLDDNNINKSIENNNGGAIYRNRMVGFNKSGSVIRKIAPLL